jgi:hypothetical protein
MLLILPVAIFFAATPAASHLSLLVNSATVSALELLGLRAPTWAKRISTNMVFMIKSFLERRTKGQRNGNARKSGVFNKN